MALQLFGVVVQPKARAMQDIAQSLSSFLHASPPTFENPQSDGGISSAEEREVDSEGLVVEAVGTGFRDQPGEMFLSLRCDPVDDLASPTRDST